MTLISFLAYSLVALSPSISIFKQNISQHPARLVIVVVGVFFYFSSLVATSIFHSILNALFNSANSILWIFAILNVFLQEFTRYLSFKLMVVARPSFVYLKDSEKTSVDSNIKLSVAIGTGFCIGAAVFNSVNILVYSLGPAVFGVNGDTRPSLMIENSLKTSALSLLNFFWTVMMFKCLEIRERELSGRQGSSPAERSTNANSTLCFQSNKWIGIVVATHLMNTLVSLLGQDYAALSILVSWILVAFVGYLLAYQMGGSISTFKTAFETRSGHVGLVEESDR